MADLRLPKLPDRTPIKITMTVSPDLAADLALYAELYWQRYEREEPVTVLAPAMLAAFLESDRHFQRARRERHEA